MANETLASVVTFPQPKKVPLTPAERQRACRARKKAAISQNCDIEVPAVLGSVTAVTDVTPAKPISPPAEPKKLTWRLDASTALTGAAFASAIVGVAMNGWYASSLGSSDAAGWLFLAIGVVADVSALTIPTCCARLMVKRQRGAAAVGWLVWLATFLFAVCAGIGFASVNISDVTSSRASRVTPAVTVAQAALSDAVTARDRECKSGTGKFCREREAAVVTQRQGLETAMKAVELQADPQVEAATRIVSWVTGGMVRPTGDDFAMLRLMLLALLPQVGGILLMVGRGSR